MSKSHVSMEQNQCFICLTIFETGNILLDRRLKQSMEQCTVTGYGICPECQKLQDDGYVALIVASEGNTSNRTGQYLFLKKEVAVHLFNNPFDKNIGFIDGQLFDQIQEPHGKAK